ncbi:TPA: ImmA/IrrE family metallo-endopeptidase [Streptococcus suis]|uniref:Domain of uncharacterized function (DUF955) n=1 Tax=Streptococcus suis TaxID=1307 RepID=A0A0Z8JZX5_STRSU|nr:ImmA/IrrE family metallo-endopeptidase [Streptococcus suis]NQG64841.1 ImmA/IrrE family metallo-endopeptidase [Streptococcus suis]NQG66569.1 ImmA/IrrE family metallo-endopeptidase [Streptococcus suis]CYV42622.1 Domain of uncharacterised function (DUF955) [Streptococcus suis]CYV63213.1 Domain of uncharacterised function (DUF955) [Streptococcus suis]HEM6175036.1 ImmA/IrrE family metallo-endopeptidase [Streptococcus suis]
MVQKIEKVIESTFYNEFFSSVNRFIVRNRRQIKVSKCDLYEINYISLHDFEVRRILSTHRIDRVLKSHLQVVAFVEVKGKNRYGYETEGGEVWLNISISYVLDSGFKNFRIEDVILSDNKHVPDSEYTAEFVPIIESKKFDSIANQILRTHQPEVLETPMSLNISSLLESIGVNLIEAKVSPDQSVFGEIVFKETTIDVFDEKNQPKSLLVPKGTIVVDPTVKDFRNQGSYNNTVVHEVVHWLLHKDYQECRMLTQTDGKNIFVDNSKIESTNWTQNDWMEWHANSIAPRLLMPKKTTKQKVNELITNYSLKYTSDQRIEMFEQIIDDLASFFQVSRLAAKIRLHQLGYHEFEGIYNFVGDQYLRSYSCELRAMSSNQSFTISFANACMLNWTNEHFRELMDSNRYVYVDSHFCLNNSKYVTMVEFGKYEMTDYAYQHMDECCLVFDLSYKYDNKKSISITSFNDYIMYRGKTTTEIVVDFSDYLNVVGNNAEIKDGKIFQELHSILDELPRSFPKTLVYHRERKNITQEKLEEVSLISVSTIRRLETKSDAAHSLEKLMALTLGMKLFPDLSFDLIDKSGTNFRNDVLYHTGYKMVLRNYYHLGAFECNELAKSLGLPEFLGK